VAVFSCDGSLWPSMTNGTCRVTVFLNFLKPQDSSLKPS
jgi:hypothetical protein